MSHWLRQQIPAVFKPSVEYVCDLLDVDEELRRDRDMAKVRSEGAGSRGVRRNHAGSHDENEIPDSEEYLNPWCKLVTSCSKSNQKTAY